MDIMLRRKFIKLILFLPFLSILNLKEFKREKIIIKSRFVLSEEDLK
jgi:hypothetical protein